MHSDILDIIGPYFIVIYILLTILSLSLAVFFLRKKISPNKPGYGVYVATLCIFLQQLYLILGSVFTSGDDYRWAIAFLYFGALYIANIATFFLVIKNAKAMKSNPVSR